MTKNESNLRMLGDRTFLRDVWYWIEMRLRRLGHVNLSVDDITTATAFYGETLGLEHAARPADQARAGAWFRLGDVELHLSLEVGANNAASKRHVAFEVDDLDAWRRTFDAQGVTMDEGRPATGVRRLFVRDPAGNRIELYETK